MSEAVVDGLVLTLVESGHCKKADAQATKQNLMEDPDGAAKLAAVLAPLAVPAVSNGRGINKESSYTKPKNPDPDGWGKVASEGA